MFLQSGHFCPASTSLPDHLFSSPTMDTSNGSSPVFGVQENKPSPSVVSCRNRADLHVLGNRRNAAGSLNSPRDLASRPHGGHPWCPPGNLGQLLVNGAVWTGGAGLPTVAHSVLQIYSKLRREKRSQPGPWRQHSHTPA